MKIKVTEAVLDYANTPVMEGQKPLTWRIVVEQALNTLLPEDANMNGEDKAKCYLLTYRAYQAEEPDFSVEERAFILNRIKRVFNPLVVGRAMEIFDKNEPSPMTREIK